MRKILIAAVLVAVGAGCADKSDRPAAVQAEATLPSLTVDEVDTMLAKHQGQPVDCNGDATRKRMGVLPGAILLTGDELDPGQLPGDKSKPLVFYCASSSCGASHHAAAAALTAGYTDVKVMPEGIAGWVKAGKQTRQL